MATPSSYVREIKSIKEELKRTATRIKLLKQQLRETEGHLYEYMTRHALDDFEGIKAKKIAPKQPSLRKSKADKKADAVRLFYEIGVADPEGFYEQFLTTQKPVPPSQDEDL